MRPNEAEAPPLVREHLGLGPDLKLLMGLSFGFEDLADPANACRIERAALPRAVTFHA